MTPPLTKSFPENNRHISQKSIRDSVNQSLFPSIAALPILNPPIQIKIAVAVLSLIAAWMVPNPTPNPTDSEEEFVGHPSEAGADLGGYLAAAPHCLDGAAAFANQVNGEAGGVSPEG